MVDEETPLTGQNAATGYAKPIQVNVEKLRFIGLISGVVMLACGKFVSKYLVVFPAKDDPSTFYDKIFNGAPSDFDESQTYIFHLFHFNHSCSVLDFNPSRTISALISLFHTIPLCLYIICDYLRIMSNSDPSFKNIQRYSKISTPLQFTFMIYFFMVFVNAPDGEFGTHEGLLKFKLHYLPYMLWQFAIMLMAIQQCWYLSLTGKIPTQWLTPKIMWYYCLLLVGLFIIYTVFVYSFMYENPIWDTTTPLGLIGGKSLEISWDLFAVGVPLVFSYLEMKDGKKATIMTAVVSFQDGFE